ncbi:MAG: dihydropteroate synthase [Planctomycetaceae bacterium]|nr:dihydropteroate synthase [Planctomycetaceae bacterium]
MTSSPCPRILFVTGRLAEPLVRRVVEELSESANFDADVCVLGISVAALMHADWLQRKLTIDRSYDRVVLPGWCQGDLESLSTHFGVPFERGPKDIRDLPAHFSQVNKPVDLSRNDIEILAEINHAPRLSESEILRIARHYADSGADVIDVGTVPGESWSRVGEVTRRLIDEGFRVSIDSFDRTEVEAAVSAGAELVLSCNSSNIEWAQQLDAELVVIPDDPHDLSSLEESIDRLTAAGSRFRVDPIIEPIGFGFAASLARYFETRRRWPEVLMMMGIGNLTELTEVDTAGMNMLLAGICQELRITSILTTEVINWARTAVKEFDVARRLAHHALTDRTLPKHVDSSLVMLRDPRVNEYGEQTLQSMAASLSDPNFRIFAERGEVHIMNRDGYWRGTDAFELFDRAVTDSGPLDSAHTFYLGYELCKAVTALTLGKQYNQDQALQWGFLTIPEASAHERRRGTR